MPRRSEILDESAKATAFRLPRRLPNSFEPRRAAGVSRLVRCERFWLPHRCNGLVTTSEKSSRVCGRHRGTYVPRSPGRFVIGLLCQDLLHNFAFNVGQAKIAAAEAIREARVIEPQEVQNRGVQVVHADLVFDCLVTNLIGL